MAPACRDADSSMRSMGISVVWPISAVNAPAPVQRRGTVTVTVTLVCNFELNCSGVHGFGVRV